MFPNPLPVAGFLHVFGNAMTAINKALAHCHPWPRLCFEHVQVLYNLVQLFVAKCMGRSVAAQAFWQAFAQRHFHGLYEKRWAEVAIFCEHLLEVLGILQSHWDLESMGQLSSDSQTEFDPQRFDMIVNNNFFHAYI